MKALVKTKPGHGNVALLEVPEPVCGPGQVKVEVHYAGICGTDQHILHDTYPNEPPVIMGHEFSGSLVEVGEGVDQFRMGDCVTVLPSTAVICGTCAHCKTGYYFFCDQRRSMGSGVDGCFTRYVVVREDMLYKIPDHVPLQQAALSEPLACAVQAAEELPRIHVGDTVLLSGPGPIGLLCLALLRLKGCRILVAGTGADSARMEIAARLGADRVVNVGQEDLREVVLEETKGVGVDVAIECAGAAASVVACLQAVRKRGTYVQVGILGKSANLEFDLILYKQLQVFGSLAHSMATWQRVMQIHEQGKIDLAPIITHRFPLGRWEEAFATSAEGRGGKVLLTCDDAR